MSGLIDFAGVFPPANLSMYDAVDRYARYRRSPDGWMLGRFVLPMRQLDEFDEAAKIHDVSNWKLSVIGSGEVEKDLARIDAFNVRAGALIDTIELQVARSEDVIRQATPIPQTMKAWFEILPGTPLPETLGALRAVNRGAKIRMGGPQVDLTPSVETVAQFLFLCARAGVRFKATAGLHHPIRSPHRLTYADDSPMVMMHGFVNLFLAACIADDAVELEVQEAAALANISAMLEEQSVSAFMWAPDHVVWQRNRIEETQLYEVRKSLGCSFGSCSFEEPLNDLRAIHWL